MESKEKFTLMARNCVEVISEDELVALSKQKTPPVVYCGYETSGEVHIGHLVTITKLLDFVAAGCKVKVLFADWHTWLNQKGDWEFINSEVEKWKKIFIAAGLDKVEFVKGSDIQRNMDYIDDILQLSLSTTLNRALRSMQEVGRNMEHAKVSQMIYPLMQAVDIKALGVDIAYAGIEQRKIHMLARETLAGLGYKAPTCVHTPLIPSLAQSGKMSSSVPESLISLRDDPQTIKGKMKKAFCPEGIAQDNPVLAIAQLVIFPRIEVFVIERPEKWGGNMEFTSFEELESAFVKKELHPMDLKDAVSRELIKVLTPIQASL